MCDGFNHSALQLAVAQICQSMGWDALQKSSHDLLTDVLRHYLEEIAKAAHGYCQQYCRTEPNLNDLSLAFQDTGVLLHELEDFVSQVDQVPFIHQLPRYPKPKASVLHHPRNGEIVDRLEHYYDYLPPLVTKLLQNEDEEKAAKAEDTDATDGGEEREGTDGFIRNEIKTVGEETHNEPVALKRHQESPPGFENETKKRRVEPPFMQKGNRGNEMDILHALQGNLSSPSPTPSPDAWCTEKTFEIPPPTLPTAVVRSTGKAKSTLASKAVASFAGEEKKPTAPNKQSGKSPAVKPKASPKKKAKPSKGASSPVKKPAASSSSTPPKVTKGSSPSLMKSPLTTTISSPQEKKANVTKDSPKKTTPKKEKKEKKPAAKAKKPQMKSPPVTKPSSGTAKENIAAKEGMPKLIIKPIKQEERKEPQFAVSELLPTDQPTSIKAKSLQPKNTKSKQSTSEKPKAKKKAKTKQAVQDSVTFKVETKEASASSVNVGLKFSIADFVAPSSNTSVGDTCSNVVGSDTGDLLSEHKKKKKKRKEKDRDKEKKKDKSKKMKVDHPASSPALAFESTPIPRIKLKLEPPVCTPLADEPSTKLDASVKGRTSSGTSSSPALEKPQPTYTAKASTAVEESEKASMTKMTIKKEPPERTVISQTVSTTFVHGYSKEYYCPVCGDPDDGTFMIGCDGCDEWFHGRCVGIEDDPGNVDWFCSSCLAKRDKDNKDKLNKKKKKKKSKGKEK